MNSKLLVRALPIIIAVVVMMFQRCTAEKFVNEAGRSALVGLDRGEENALGLQAYREVLSSNDVITHGKEYEIVRRCASRLAQATSEWGRDFQWEVSVVNSNQVNAFCLPGGKIVVYTGILPVAQNETGLAVVMGHEMAHATLRHGSERMLRQKNTNTLLTGVNFSLGEMSYQQRQLLMGAIGAGAQYGLLLPFSRDHESEADAVGLQYMARAGYNPSEAIAFWQRMGSASQGKTPPEFASTHPSHETRINRIKADLPKAMQIYQQSQQR
jgi:metalloendopeptidase OMA1, mitochondrial